MDIGQELLLVGYLTTMHQYNQRWPEIFMVRYRYSRSKNGPSRFLLQRYFKTLSCCTASPQLELISPALSLPLWSIY